MDWVRLESGVWKRSLDEEEFSKLKTMREFYTMIEAKDFVTSGLFKDFAQMVMHPDTCMKLLKTFESNLPRGKKTNKRAKNGCMSDWMSSCPLGIDLCDEMTVYFFPSDMEVAALDVCYAYYQERVEDEDLNVYFA